MMTGGHKEIDSRGVLQSDLVSIFPERKGVIIAESYLYCCGVEYSFLSKESFRVGWYQPTVGVNKHMAGAGRRKRRERKESKKGEARKEAFLC